MKNYLQSKCSFQINTDAKQGAMSIYHLDRILEGGRHKYRTARVEIALSRLYQTTLHFMDREPVIGAIISAFWGDKDVIASVEFSMFLPVGPRCDIRFNCGTI